MKSLLYSPSSDSPRFIKKITSSIYERNKGFIWVNRGRLDYSFKVNGLRSRGLFYSYKSNSIFLRESKYGKVRVQISLLFRISKLTNRFHTQNHHYRRRSDIRIRIRGEGGKGGEREGRGGGGKEGQEKGVEVETKVEIVPDVFYTVICMCYNCFVY